MNELINGVIFLLTIYQFLILAVVLLSWINPDPYNPIVRFLRQVSDPVLMPFRRLLMPLTMRIRIDLSPIIVFLLIGFIQNILRRIQFGGLTLESIGMGLITGVLAFIMAVFLFLFILCTARSVTELTHADQWNPIVRFITTVTDPVVYQFRKFAGRNRRYNFAPVAASLTFLVAYLVVSSIRNLL
jgi:YggT family protein